MATKKQIVRMTALLLALTVLMFAMFIVLEAGHDCTGQDCPICRMLKACVMLLASFVVAAVLWLAAGRCADAERGGFICAVIAARSTSLVALKVKLTR